MDKLNLNLDELSVDSFATDDASDNTGTVRGHAETYELVSCYDTGCNTCDDYTCGNTCGCGGGDTDTCTDDPSDQQIVCI